MLAGTITGTVGDGGDPLLVGGPSRSFRNGEPATPEASGAPRWLMGVVGPRARLAFRVSRRAPGPRRDHRLSARLKTVMSGLFSVAPE